MTGMADPVDVDLLARELVVRLTATVRTMRVNQSGGGLSRAQLSVLGALRRGPHGITSLAELDQVSQPSMTVLVARMERAGWVSRHRDGTDRRTVRVQITEQGRKRYAAGLDGYAAVLMPRLAALDAQGRDVLRAAIPVLDALLADPAGPCDPDRQPPTRTKAAMTE